MTARLKTWLDGVDLREKRIAALPLFRRYGRLTRATGLVMEAVGLKLPIGTLCIVERESEEGIQRVESEVVGFNGEILYLMPLENVEGVLPGARVYALGNNTKGKQLPLGPELLGRVLDASARPLDGLPPPNTSDRGPLFTPPFNPLQRDPIKNVLDVGVRAINGLLTVGRGQRMGLFAGSGVGQSGLLGVVGFYRAGGRYYPAWLSGARPWPAVALMAFGFWWLNGALMRALAWYGDVAWNMASLWDSRLIQTSFALFWMLSALVVMIHATRRASRQEWLCGAALLGVVIVKLMLVDSAGGGGLSRAVAFIGVAILVLIVGYFSPLPPKTGDEK